MSHRQLMVAILTGVAALAVDYIRFRKSSPAFEQKYDWSLGLAWFVAGFAGSVLPTSAVGE